MIAVQESTMNDYIGTCLNNLLGIKMITVNAELKLTHYQHKERKTFTMDDDSTLLAIIRKAKKAFNMQGKKCDIHHQGGAYVLVFDNAMLSIEFE